MTRKRIQRVIITILIWLTCTLLLSSNGMHTTRAAPNAPDYSGSLSPDDIYVDTERAALIISGLGGVEPPSSTWYGPDGYQITAGCIGGQQIRKYIYYGGSLSVVIDYFYIRDCNRDPGQYRVTVGNSIDISFAINPQIHYVYIPIIQR